MGCVSHNRRHGPNFVLVVRLYCSRLIISYYLVRVGPLPLALCIQRANEQTEILDEMNVRDYGNSKTMTFKKRGGFSISYLV